MAVMIASRSSLSVTFFRLFGDGGLAAFVPVGNVLQGRDALYKPLLKRDRSQGAGDLLGQFGDL